LADTDGDIISDGDEAGVTFTDPLTTQSTTSKSARISWTSARKNCASAPSRI